MSGPDGGWLLPADPEPENVKQICVTVPDEPAYRQAFAGALLSLTKWYNWQRDELHTAAIVTAVWRPLIAQALQNLDDNAGCGGGGVECCDNLQLQINQIIEYNNGQTNQQREAAYDGNPDSINPLAPDGLITDGTDPDRTTALCLAVQRYVGQILYLRVTGQCAVDVAAAILGVVGGFLIGGPVGAVVGGVVVGAAVHQCLDLAAALEDEEARNEAICRIVQAFEGVPLTQANFEDVWPLISSDNPDAQIIIDEVAQFSQRLANYLFFIDLLGAAYDQAQAGVEADCGCVDDCLVLFDFTKYGYGGRFINWGDAQPAGSRVPGVGLVNSSKSSDSGGGLYSMSYRFPVSCGSTSWPTSRPYLRMVYECFQPTADIRVRWEDGAGAVATSGPLPASVGVHTITEDFTEGLSPPPHALLVRVTNDAHQSGVAVRSLELSNVPF